MKRSSSPRRRWPAASSRPRLAIRQRRHGQRHRHQPAQLNSDADTRSPAARDYQCYLNSQAYLKSHGAAKLPPSTVRARADAVTNPTATTAFVDHVPDSEIDHQIVIQLAAPAPRDRDPGRSSTDGRASRYEPRSPGHAEVAQRRRAPAFSCSVSGTPVSFAAVAGTLPASFVSEQVAVRRHGAASRRIARASTRPAGLQRYFQAHRGRVRHGVLHRRRASSAQAGHDGRGRSRRGTPFATVASAPRRRPAGLRALLAPRGRRSGWSRHSDASAQQGRVDIPGDQRRVPARRGSASARRPIRRRSPRRRLQQAGATNTQAALGTASGTPSMSVDPRYGMWSRTTASVLCTFAPRRAAVLNARPTRLRDTAADGQPSRRSVARRPSSPCGLGPAGTELLGDQRRLSRSAHRAVCAGPAPAAAARSPASSASTGSTSRGRPSSRVRRDRRGAGRGRGRRRRPARGLRGARLAARRRAHRRAAARATTVDVIVVPALSLPRPGLGRAGHRPRGAGRPAGDALALAASGASGAARSSWPSAAASAARRRRAEPSSDPARRPPPVVLHHLGLDDEQVVAVGWWELDRTRARPPHVGVLPVLAEPRRAASQWRGSSRSWTRCARAAPGTGPRPTRRWAPPGRGVLRGARRPRRARRPPRAGAEAADGSTSQEELGDLLFQIVFHARWPPKRALRPGRRRPRRARQLVQRHPHVFGDVAADDPRRRWRRTGRRSRRQEKGRHSVTEGIPAALPALMLDGKLPRKARVGRRWSLGCRRRRLAVERRLARGVAAGEGRPASDDPLGRRGRRPRRSPRCSSRWPTSPDASGSTPSTPCASRALRLARRHASRPRGVPDQRAESQPLVWTTGVPPGRTPRERSRDHHRARDRARGPRFPWQPDRGGRGAARLRARGPCHRSLGCVDRHTRGGRAARRRHRFGGKGVQRAVANVNGEIAEAIGGSTRSTSVPSTSP